MERLVHIDVQGCWPDGLKNHHTVIPWSSHLEIHKVYGNTQTAEQIAKRGGFGLKEAVLYYKWEKPIVWFSKKKDTWPKTEEDWIKVEYHFNIKNKKIIGINLHII